MSPYKGSFGNWSVTNWQDLKTKQFVRYLSLKDVEFLYIDISYFHSLENSVEAVMVKAQQSLNLYPQNGARSYRVTNKPCMNDIKTI